MKITEQIHQEFADAVYAGETQKVEQLLDKGVPPDGPEDCPDFFRPLALALSSGNREIAELLVSRGASPRTGRNALGDCIDNPDLNEWVNHIIADACPETSENLQEALVHACEVGKREIAETLLDACPKPSAFTFRSCPLARAISSQQNEIALWLMDVGFGPQSHLSDANPPVVYAIIADEARLLQRLLEQGQSIDQAVGGHQTVFTCVPKLYRRLKHVRDYPKNNKFEVFHKGSLLHVAAVAGSSACAAVLLEAGANVDAIDSEGRTPTMLAAIGGHHTAAVLKLLPKPDLSNPDVLRGQMTRGLRDGDLTAVRDAIEHGFDLSTTIKTSYQVSWTPLTFAAIQGNVDVLQTLIEAGADIDSSDWTESKRPVMKGLRYLYDNAGLEAFTDPAAPIDRTAVGWASLHGHVDAVKLLIDHGANLKAVDALSMTALHAAAMGNKPKVIAMLVDAECDLHAEAFDKMTPLHVAAEVNGIQSVKKLVELGADPTRSNKRGESPFLSAKLIGKTGAYRFLESHTPEDLRKKKRKPKPPPPSLVGGKNELKRILAAAKKRFGNAAKRSYSAKVSDRLVEIANSEEFQTTAEAVRKKLKGKEWGRWQEVPQILLCDGVKISDARLLKLRTEFLPSGVFITRALLPTEDGVRVFLVPSADMFEVFATFHTDGINFGIHDELMLAWLMDLHDRHPFQLVSVGHDGLEPRFEETPSDIDSLMRELLTICPPEDDEQAATKWLKRRLRSKTPQPFLWWD